MTTTGTIDNPLDLVSALSYNLIKPGHTIFLREGIYTGDFTDRLIGTEQDPIIIRSYPGEKAIIDGTLVIQGSYTQWHEIEFMSSLWKTRSTINEGSSPPDLPYKFISVNAPGSKLINCVIHDMADGPEWYSKAVNSELYGNIIFNIGWSAIDRGHGHLIYSQNETGIKTAKDNIGFNSFSTGLKIYTETGHAQGYNIIGNTIFNSGYLYSLKDDLEMNFWAQDPTPGTGYNFDSNMSYHSKLNADGIRIGLYNPLLNVKLNNNYFPDGDENNLENELIENTNNYYGPTLGNNLFIRPNEYINTRSNVTIYNEASADTIEVDLTSVMGLEVGDTVNVRNVQDYFVDIQELTLDTNKKVIVNMQAANRTVATPTAWTAPPTTFPIFGCFVVEKA